MSSPKTMKVRILVRVDVDPDDGIARYSAHGWGTEHDTLPDEATVRTLVGEMQADHAGANNPRLTWVTAEVPVPDGLTEVEGATSTADEMVTEFLASNEADAAVAIDAEIVGRMCTEWIRAAGHDAVAAAVCGPVIVGVKRQHDDK